MWKPKGSKTPTNSEHVNDPNQSSLTPTTKSSMSSPSSSQPSTTAASNTATTTTTTMTRKNGINNKMRPTPPQNKLTPKSLLTDHAIRASWKPGAFVEIYSESQQKWNRGKIIKIFVDDEGEWLVIKYAGSTKEIQRFNECVRPIPSQTNNLENNTPNRPNMQNSNNNHHQLQKVEDVPSKPLAVGAFTINDNKIITAKNTVNKTATNTLSTTHNSSIQNNNNNNNAHNVNVHINVNNNTHSQTLNMQQQNGQNGVNKHTQNNNNGVATKSNVAIMQNPTTAVINNNNNVNAINPIPMGCPHGMMTAEALRNLKLRNRKVCAVHGLPSFATEVLLRMNEWYGQFRGITNISINKNKPNYKMLNDKDSIAAFITFDNELSAAQAIHFSNTATFGDGRKLRAAFGIQYYCRNFLGQKPCIEYCRYKHEWADPKDVITIHDMDDFKARDCGLSLDAVKEPKQGMHNNSMTSPTQQQQLAALHAAANQQQQQLNGINREQLQKLMNERIAMKNMNIQLVANSDKLKQQYVEMQLKYKALMGETAKWKEANEKYKMMLQENMKLKVENKKIKNELQLMEALKHENQKLKQEIIQLNKLKMAQNTKNGQHESVDLVKLKEENEKLKQKNLGLLDEKNVLQIQFDELQSKYKAAAKKNTNYLTWNARDVADWIVSLNEKQYAQYKDELIKNMLAEGIDGHCLSDLERSDLHRLGITGFKDKKDVYNSIHQLTKSPNTKRKFNLK